MGEGYDYLYGGKEKQRFNGLDWYDFGARFYDEATGRFFSQDRLAEKYYSQNPYHYTLNNPVSFIEVNGDSVGFRDDQAQDDYNSLKNNAQEKLNRRSELMGKRDFTEEGLTDNEQSELNDLDAVAGELTGMLNEMHQMENSDTWFNISSEGPQGADGLIMANQDGSLELFYDGAGSENLGILAHELKHGHQYLTGDLDFLSGSDKAGFLWDIGDEVAAFKRQVAVLGQDPNTITSSFVRNLHPNYQLAPSQDLNTSSTAHRVLASVMLMNRLDPNFFRSMPQPRIGESYKSYTSRNKFPFSMK